MPVRGGSPVKLGLSGAIKTPAVRSGGKEIAFALRESDDNEVWTLENFLNSAAR